MTNSRLSSYLLVGGLIFLSFYLLLDDDKDQGRNNISDVVVTKKIEEKVVNNPFAVIEETNDVISINKQRIAPPNDTPIAQELHTTNQVDDTLEEYDVIEDKKINTIAVNTIPELLSYEELLADYPNFQLMDELISERWLNSDFTDEHAIKLTEKLTEDLQNSMIDEPHKLLFVRCSVSACEAHITPFIRGETKNLMKYVNLIRESIAAFNNVHISYVTPSIRNLDFYTPNDKATWSFFVHVRKNGVPNIYK